MANAHTFEVIVDPDGVASMEADLVGALRRLPLSREELQQYFADRGCRVSRSSYEDLWAGLVRQLGWKTALNAVLAAINDHMQPRVQELLTAAESEGSVELLDRDPQLVLNLFFVNGNLRKLGGVLLEYQEELANRLQKKTRSDAKRAEKVKAKELKDEKPKDPAPSSTAAVASVPTPTMPAVQPSPTDAGRPPTCFISYSWDSEDHKAWVLQLAVALREEGVDATIDRWKLQPGISVAWFMETMRSYDWIVVVCTSKYVAKADQRTGGVGYETQILTAETVRDLQKAENRIIPIVREGKATPTHLDGRLYVDFRDDGQFNSSIEELVRRIHGAPALVAPPLGRNRFRP